MLSYVTNRDIFPTPIVVAGFAPPDADALNAELEQIILEKEKQACGVRISNHGGWQSDTKILEWGGAPVARLVDEMCGVLDRITLFCDGSAYHRVATPWRVHGWANINRKGHHNVVHTHPGAYWSAVYYVKLPTAPEPVIGGELELLDPRGTLPIMYCPELRFGLKGSTSAGTSELHKPRAGEMIIFPAWLPHAVAPHHGDDTRISIAFNFSV